MNLFIAGALFELTLWHATEGRWWEVTIDVTLMVLNLAVNAIPSTRGVKP